RARSRRADQGTRSVRAVRPGKAAHAALLVSRAVALLALGGGVTDHGQVRACRGRRLVRAVVGQGDRRQLLLAAPLVEDARPVHAADRAERRAGLLGVELAADVLARVLRERDARVAALLRAVVHEALLADVEVAGAGAALPVVRLAVDEVVLKPADARVD